MTLIRGWLPSTIVETGTFLEPAVDNGYGYEATTGGRTGTAEPSWPTPAGATVVDGTVTWTARLGTRLTWEAETIFESGVAEPAWPLVAGNTVDDGGIRWTARTPAITDAPKSHIAFPQSQKVFVPYKDVLRFCAVNNARDWESEDDAGFLPTGMNSPVSPDVTAVGEYRGRLAVFSPSSLQIWTTDPDPLEQSLFDNVDGIGTVYDKSIASVSGDLLFMTPMGVRSLSIAAGAANLQAGDIGTGIDELVQAKLAGPDEPFAFYYPGGGQYWLVFGSEVFVYSQSRLGRVGAWSRYTFPYDIQGATVKDGELYLRSPASLLRVDESSSLDNVDPAVPSSGSPIVSYVWWPFMDLGSPGVTKMLHSMEIVADSDAAYVSAIYVGANQRDAVFPDDYTLVASSTQTDKDTLAGSPIPVGIAGPSFSIRIDMGSVVQWELYGISLTIQDGAQTGQP